MPRVIVGTGLIALDVVVNDTEPSVQRVYAGGTCGNVLTILSWLGWSAWPVARLAADRAAKEVLKDLKRWQVNTGLCKLSPTASTPVIVERLAHDEHGRPRHRFSWSCPSCGTWLPSFRPVVLKAVETVLATVPSPDVLFVDRACPSSIALASAYRKRGALVVFEPSGKSDSKTLGEMMKHCNIIKYADDRMGEWSTSLKPPKDGFQIETLGEAGLRFRGKSQRAWKRLAAVHVSNLVDSAGAGDWCTAGMIHALCAAGVPFENVEQAMLSEALRIGQALAAWNCSFVAPRGGMYSQLLDEAATDIAGLLDGSESPRKPGRLKMGRAADLLRCVSAACAEQE